MKFVYMVALLAWGADNVGTSDSGHFADTTLSDCHARSQAFSKKHSTPVQLCIRISEKGYNVIASGSVEFDFTERSNAAVANEFNEENERLRAALKEIGRWHTGKTRDSQRVRAIIKKATQ